MLRTDPARLRDQFRLVRDMNLNTIRLEGKLDTEDFFHLADKQRNSRDAGLVLLRPLGALERLDPGRPDHRHGFTALADAAPAPPPEPAGVAQRQRQSSAGECREAYLDVEAETHWPNPILSSASERPTTVSGESGVKMTGPYDYVAPSYWYVDTAGAAPGDSTPKPVPGPAIPSLASRKKFLSDPEAWPPIGRLEPAQRRREVSRRLKFSTARWTPSTPSPARPPTTSAWRRPWSTTPSAPCSSPTPRTSTSPPA